MSIREIINAATSGKWFIIDEREPLMGIGANERCVVPADEGDCYDNPQQSLADLRFIATFNPEHVALMEAVIQNIDFYDGGICRWCGEASLNPHLTGCEMYMLEAYRKERGLL